MSVPKKKRTSSSVGRRRSHHGLKAMQLTTCTKCGKTVEPHRACGFCGTYKSREVIKTKEEAKSAK